MLHRSNVSIPILQLSDENSCTQSFTGSDIPNPWPPTPLMQLHDDSNGCVVWLGACHQTSLSQDLMQQTGHHHPRLHATYKPVQSLFNTQKKQKQKQKNRDYSRSSEHLTNSIITFQVNHATTSVWLWSFTTTMYQRV